MRREGWIAARAGWWGAWFALLVAVCAAPGAARADDGWNHAGLVVRHGDGRIVYAYVVFPEESISAVELVRRSGLPLVTIAFGGLGEGVCTLNDEGCPASECRRRVCQGPDADDPFWQYFRQDADGVWTTMALGASASEVRDGDVDAWAWTGKEAGLPPLTLADVARLAGVAAGGTAAGSDGLPTPAVRTVYPAGMGPGDQSSGDGWREIAAGTALLAVVGAATVLIARSRTRGEGAA